MHLNKAGWTSLGQRVVGWEDFYHLGRRFLPCNRKKSPWFSVELKRGADKYNKNAEQNRKHTYVSILACVVHFNIV